ncbi:unnamed protein product [Ranitomeya imitator]|uniref:SAM domain-containing protein n=1 Tax=Ranitomeya imitator TaxID=111125 RepID=A0ABN9L4D1_9NEOB|nr:unnamed protein product [Ranitomeya imitator]
MVSFKSSTRSAIIKCSYGHIDGKIKWLWLLECLSSVNVGFRLDQTDTLQGIRIELKEPLALKEIPIDWTVNDVVEYIKSTDCAHLAQLFQEQEIDGKALLLLNLPAVQDCMDLKPATAIRLCYHIERVKLAFYQSLPR